MLTSNEHSVMFRTMTNGDLCDFLRSFAYEQKPQKMAANISVTERNIFPVLYNINLSTVILLQQ